MNVGTITMMVLNRGESHGSVMIFKGGEEKAKKLKETFHNIFVIEQVDRFLKELENSLNEIKKQDLGLEVLGENASIADLGDMGKMISIKLGFPQDYVLLQYAKRVWKNPRDPSELYISYEINIYLSNGLFDNFQRVIVMKGGLLYNVSLKV